LPGQFGIVKWGPASVRRENEGWVREEEDNEPNGLSLATPRKLYTKSTKMDINRNIVFQI
jgi:hypothetical protein